MGNIFFDLCAIPIFMVILWTCVIRRITKDHASRVFIMINVVSLVCAVLDIGMEVVLSPVPLPPLAVKVGSAITYAYLLLRNSTLVLCLVFVFAVSRTEYLIRPRSVRLLIWLPNAVLLAMLVQNLFTGNVFTVTAEAGYARGPAMAVLYGIAAVYGLAGSAYSIYCKRYLTTDKWIALISVYLLSFIAVTVQMLVPELLVEMFSSALGLMMVMLLVMRPEENLDAAVGTESWKAYQADLKNIVLSGQRVQIAVLHQPNAPEIRNYLGEDQYNAYVAAIGQEIESAFRREKAQQIDLYFEHPGTFYLILQDMDFDITKMISRLDAAVRERVRPYTDRGVRFSPRVCLIRVPEDVSGFQDIINLGHRFHQLGKQEQQLFIAADILRSPTYEINAHMEEILNRAITEKSIQMYYQPIYNLKEGRFLSAEALARLVDREYGMISPGLFIPAAESVGLMLPIGDIVLESVFRFISGHDLEALGLSYVEINLSVEQCLQADLPDNVRRLQEKYGVNPDQVNFEITETMFDNLSGVMDRNLRELSEMGYSFSLDDYGVGYSNIRRLRTLPLRIIKIDKSMVDDMFSEEGEVIIKNTVRMMQGIHKELVVEGVETREAIEACNDLSCDFIQGFYYSRPLPEDEFVAFLEDHRQKA